MLWKRLYNMVWLAAFSLMIFPRWFGKYSAVVHVGLGLAIIVLSKLNSTKLAALPVPDRVKRISAAVFTTSVLLAVVGVVFGGVKHMHVGPEWVASVIGGFHVFLGLAVLAQSSSLATAYDMWEEKEIGPSATPPPAGPPPATS